MSLYLSICSFRTQQRETRLDRRTAVVIGASIGIGLAIAERLAAEGCDLHIYFREPAETIERAEQEIQAPHGRNVTARAFDLSDSRSVRPLLAAAGNATSWSIMRVRFPVATCR